jgi:hypothetical protein
MLISSPSVHLCTASIQLIKHVCNSSGFSRANNRSNVSTDQGNRTRFLTKKDIFRNNHKK